VPDRLGVDDPVVPGRIGAVHCGGVSARHRSPAEFCELPWAALLVRTPVEPVEVDAATLVGRNGHRGPPSIGRSSAGDDLEPMADAASLRAVVGDFAHLEHDCWRALEIAET
jgi:hypothetical protein